MKVKELLECGGTCAGSVASIAMPLGAIRRRIKPMDSYTNIIKPAKKKKPKKKD